MAETIKIASLEIDNKKLLSELQSTKKRIEELSASQKELAKAGDTTSAIFIKNEAELKNLQKEYRAQSKVLQTTTNATTRLNDALNKNVQSIDDAKKQNKELVEIRNQLDTSTKKGKKSLDDINKTIDKNNDLIKENTSKLEKQKSNVGNYPSLFGKAKGAVIGFGSALKALGIGFIVAGIAKLTEAFGRNQKVADAVSTVFNAVGIVFDKVVGTIVDTVEAVSQANGGFDALGKVMSGLLTLIITPLKASFFAIKLAILEAQRGWENSFFGGKDADKLKELDTKINETKDTLVEIGAEAISAGAKVATNFGEAFNEVADGASAVGTAVSNIDFSNVVKDAKALTEIKKNTEGLIIAQEGVVQRLERQSEKFRQLRDDESLSFEDRQKASDDLLANLNKQSKAERDLIGLRLANAQKEASLNKGNVDLQNEVLRLKNEQLAVENKIESQKSEQKTSDATLNKDKLTSIQDFENKKDELLDSINERRNEDEFKTQEEKLQRDFDRQEAEIENLQLTEEEKTELLKLLELDRDLQLQEIKNNANIAKVEKQAELDLAEIESDNALAQAKINNARQVTGILNTILGDSLAARIASIVAESALAVAQVKINTAQANAQIVANTQIANAKAVATSPLTGGLPFTAINTALQIKGIAQNKLSAGLNIAQILASSVVKLASSKPKAEKGMYVERGGLLSGARHSQGGINIEAEDGEAIINRKSTAKYLPLLSAINQDGGGVSFGRFERGGIAGSVPAPSTGNIIDIEALATAVANQPAPVVSVEEISSVSNRVNVIESQSVL
ncbi:hypothetical protein [Psychroserpens mesophilus]|uniref:hypothetical protein n=1 Tax=Psychroserpens mesophilus TaxID=325473 RepID=UPI003D658BD4